jgi:hypothetical protein
MKIIRVEKHTTDELLKQIRQVTLLNQPDELIYQDAYASLEMISVDVLFPAQHYILKSELEKVRRLKLELSKHGINLYKLNGYVTFWLEDAADPIDLLPAVVEESVEANGKPVNIINDGMHRLFMARLEWVIPQIIFIRGISKDKPYYAYPVPGGWNTVKIVDELPPDLMKKWHRIENYKTLYRDFNSAFTNVGGPRGRFAKNQ